MTVSAPDSAAAALSAALRIIDDAWEELRRSVFVQTQMGLPLAGLRTCLSRRRSARAQSAARSCSGSQI